jgi:hypothetical protein
VLITNYNAILEKLVGKKLELYLRNMGRHNHLTGMLSDINSDIITIIEKNEEMAYISLPEVSLIVEKNKKSRSKIPIPNKQSDLASDQLQLIESMS